MIYAQLTVFGWFFAYITAENKEEFIKQFQNVANDCIKQYEDIFLVDIGAERKQKITADMLSLARTPPDSLTDLSYDLKIDGNGHKGIVEVTAIFTSREEVLTEFQKIVDDLNTDIEDPEERWAVFGGGFFPEENGYEIEDLFK